MEWNLAVGDEKHGVVLKPSVSLPSSRHIPSSYLALYFACVMRWRYSIISPVSSSTTELANHWETFSIGIDVFVGVVDRCKLVGTGINIDA